MRKVIGIGETILDIIFRNNQPIAAVPGGSAFNSIISLGRAGVNSSFISETGDDKVGENIINFLKENHVDASYISIYPDTNSPISLAFLDEKNDAQYIFYKDHPHDKFSMNCPEIEPDDIVMFGSFYAINPVIREQFYSFIKTAYEKGAILYYDINFRKSHTKDLVKTMSNILENFELCDILRGSTEDFENMFQTSDPQKVYHDRIEFYCHQFICTNAGKEITLRTSQIEKKYPVKEIETVSTIGAGDNFNAGIIYGMIKYGIMKADIPNLSEADWDKIINCGQSFAANVCKSIYNSIDPDFGKQLDSSILQPSI